MSIFRSSTLLQVLRPVAAAALFCVLASAEAQVSLSGFGTAGYAVSDKSYAYQRFVDHNGTFERDTVLGLQADAKISNEFSVVAQGKLSPSIRNDSGWDPLLTWAFLAWRPNNDVLLRIGRFRVPYYLNSANLDVGVTYDAAQLPTELYSISTTNETNGIALSSNWGFRNSELLLDAYAGVSNSYWRFFFRDGLSPGGIPAQRASFIPTRIQSAGLALTFTHEENIFRTGIHVADVTRRDGEKFTTGADKIMLTPTQGFYPPSDNFFLSPDYVLPKQRVLRFNIFTLGMDIALGSGFRLVGEYARRASIKAKAAGPDTHGGYLSLQRKMGPWNPYVSIARLLSTDDSLELQSAINSNRVSAPPLPSAGLASLINTTQRLNADRLVVYDQGTLALGTSYLLSPNQKIKAEWAVTHIGRVSNFVDVPQGRDISHTNIQVFSMSYNFTF